MTLRPKRLCPARSRQPGWHSANDLEHPGRISVAQKVESFLQGSLRSRPDVDLNAYYLLTLNEEASISVIDPLLGFGGTKLLTLVLLKSPGEDWALTSDRSKLFVSMPQ